MFAQVITGRVGDPHRMRAQFDKWTNELMPEAKGFLGSTVGVTDDGEFVAIARFESEEAARANSNRVEQGAWWAETASLLDGDPTFHDCTEIDVWQGGGSDTAGFVQVIQGRTANIGRLKALGEEMGTDMNDMRPDVIGGRSAWHGDGSFTEVIYFSSEAEARENEAKEVTGRARELMDEYQSLVTDLRYFDLREPMMVTP